MANTLSNLIPDVYAALDVVSRELVGAIPGVSRDASADGVAVGQTLRAHQTRSNGALGDVAAAMAFPAAADQTIDNKSLTITKSRFAPFSWTGEEQRGLDNGGPGYLSIKQDQIAQAFRALVNEMEADVCTALYQGGSRATGASGTIPFASNLGDSAQVRRILDDNGAPMSGRSLVIDTAAGAALRTIGQLTKANEAGTSMTLRDGELLNMHGFSIRESAQIQRPAVGTSSTAIVATGGVALGATSIVLKAAGTGTIVAGDVITIADDDSKYVVTVGAAAVSGATIQIAAPGLRKAIVGEKAITIAATGARNIAFSSNALVLAARVPIMPAEGDLAIDSEIITDPRTGISFDLRCYPGVGMVTYRLQAAWGWKVIKPEHVAVLMG
jgi:hypothetical protein